MRFGVIANCSRIPSLFSNPEKGFCRNWGFYPARPAVTERSCRMSTYELRCRECGKTWGNQPRSICEDCFSPLEVSYDYDAIRPAFTRERIAQCPPNMWRYAELLPLPENFQPSLPVGFTPLLSAPHLAREIGAKRL